MSAADVLAEDFDWSLWTCKYYGALLVSVLLFPSLNSHWRSRSWFLSHLQPKYEPFLSITSDVKSLYQAEAAGWRRPRGSVKDSSEPRKRCDFTFEEGRHLSELGDALLSVAALSLQLLQAVQELPAGHTGVNAVQLLVNLPPLNTSMLIIPLRRHPSASVMWSGRLSPCGYLLRRVLHRGQRIPPLTNTVTVRTFEGCSGLHGGDDSSYCLYLKASSVMKARLLL